MSLRATVVVAATTVGMALTGCAGESGTPPEPSAAATNISPAGGPLVVRAGDGRIGVDAPRGDAVWTASFGVHVCVRRETTAPVTHEAVRYPRRSGAGHVSTRLLTITASEVRRRPTGLGSDIGPVRDIPTKYGGTLHSIEGAVVTNRCGDTTGGEAQVLTSLNVGPEGLAVEGFDLLYRVGPRHYRVSSRFTDVACGSAQGGSCRPS